MDDRKHLPPLAKLALDIGPLVLFFVVNGRWGIYAATGIFMVAIVVALIVSYAMIRRFPVMTVVSAVIVMVFGGLTIWLQDDTFIKMKPTIIYALFAGVLGIGLLMKKPLLAIVFDAMFHLTDEGWRKLTTRWALFFVFMAALNEIVWRTQSTDFWVGFKLFGAIPLTFVFALLQYPLMAKYDTSGENKAPR
ncbi:MAG: septation protein A [Pseudorhodoplanes sp.]|nr:septation protein A [Pseudorhodoplanes sp.]